MATKAITRFDSFADSTILPAGYSFHEWIPGNNLIPAPNMGPERDVNGCNYLDYVMGAIESTDGRYAMFQLKYIPTVTPEMERGIIYLSVAELAAAVDKAIEQLAA